MNSERGRISYVKFSPNKNEGNKIPLVNTILFFSILNLSLNKGQEVKIIIKTKVEYRELDMQMKFSVLFGFQVTKEETSFGMKLKPCRIFVNLNP